MGRGVVWAEGSGIGVRAKARVGGALEGVLGSGARGKESRLGRRQRNRGAGKGLGRVRVGRGVGWAEGSGIGLLAKTRVGGRVGRGVGWAEGSGIGTLAKAWVGGAWEGS